MKLFFQLFAATLILCILVPNTSAQSTIWSEDFTYVDGTTAGPAGKWTSACGACISGDYFEVRNNAFAGSDVNDWSVWESEVINIASCSDVSFSLLSVENGDHDGPGCACGINIDYFDVYYSLNGGAYQVIENWNGDGEPGHTLTGDSQNGIFTDLDWQSTTISQTGLSGTTLRLRIELRNTAGAEEMVFDDIVVLCTPLPVELTRFSAVPVGETVELSWETALESGSDHFEIERSGNGTSFFSIGQVFAAGNTDQITHYSFTDLAPVNGPTFYRLRQVDQDGSFSYTQVVEVEGQTEELALAGLYPNPASDRLYLQVFAASEKKGTLQILDLMGREVHRETASLQANQNELEINTSVLPAGIYVLRLQVGNEVVSRKFQVK